MLVAVGVTEAVGTCELVAAGVGVRVSVAVGAPMVVAVEVSVGKGVFDAVGDAVGAGVSVAGGATRRRRGLTMLLRASVTDIPLLSIRARS